MTTYRDKVNDYFSFNSYVNEPQTKEILTFQLSRSNLRDYSYIIDTVKLSQEAFKEPTSFWGKLLSRGNGSDPQKALDNLTLNMGNIDLIYIDSNQMTDKLKSLKHQFEQSLITLAEKIKNKEAARKEIIFSFCGGVRAEANNYFDKVLGEAQSLTILQRQALANIELLLSTYLDIMKTITILKHVVMPSLQLLLLSRRHKGLRAASNAIPTNLSKLPDTSGSIDRHVELLNMERDKQMRELEGVALSLNSKIKKLGVSDE